MPLRYVFLCALRLRRMASRTVARFAHVEWLHVIFNIFFSPKTFALQRYNFFRNNPRKGTKFLNLGLLFSSPPLLSSLFLTPDLYTSLLLFLKKTHHHAPKKRSKLIPQLLQFLVLSNEIIFLVFPTNPIHPQISGKLAPDY